MATASPVIAGTLWELTRRCVGRQFLLRPDPEIRQAILHCFGYCSAKWDVLIHVLSMMMNHYHDPITDLLGQRVEYTTELHALIARCIKALRGEDGEPLDGAVWDPSEQTGRVMLLTEEAFIEACAYAIANPVEAGLVHNLSEWPGFVSSPWDMVFRKEITVRRPACLPEHYPETATLRFSMPEQFRGREYEIARAIDKRVEERIRDARKKAAEEGRRFRTREELMSVDPFDSPKTKKRKTEINPALRAANHRVMRTAKKQLVAWLRAYRSAFEAFRKGMRDVVWPLGTWYYAKYAGVAVADGDGWSGFGVE